MLPPPLFTAQDPDAILPDISELSRKYTEKREKGALW